MGSEDRNKRELFLWMVPPVQEVLGGEHSNSLVLALRPNEPLLSRGQPTPAANVG